MAFELSGLTILGLAGGGILAATGAFVLVHAPRSPTTFVFFVFAAADAAATILFQVSYIDTTMDVRLGAQGGYWWFQMTALGALAAFGVLFPRPMRSAAFARGVALVAALAVLAGIAAYVAAPAAFWSVRGAGASASFPTGPAGFVVQLAYGVIVTVLLVRMSLLARDARAGSHADQAAFVFSGIALAYAPAPATLLVLRATSDTGLWGALPRALSSASFIFVVLATVAAGILALRLTGRARIVILATVTAILAVVLLSVLGVASWATLQTIAVFVGPILLAYAILRYAVFDIDARVRAAAKVGLSGAGIAVVFVVAEVSLENVIQDRVLGGISSQTATTLLAGILAAALMLPVSRVAERIGRRVVPVRDASAHHVRKLEIYRHAVEGARIANGLERESTVLRHLRESLGISDHEHDEILRAA